MKILKLIKLVSFLFVLSLMVISCSKESGITTETNEGEIVPTEEVDQNSLLSRSVSSVTGLELDCITISYPFDLVDVNDDIHNITNYEDYIALFDSTGGIFIVDFVYPLNIEDEDGNTSSVEDAEALGEAFASCLPNGWDQDAFPAYLISLENSCLTILYPITVSKEDGSLSTYENEDAFVAALAEEILFFTFPLSLADQDGETIVVNGIDELLTALFDCNGLDIDTTIWDGGNDFEFIGCYSIVFPFSVIVEDGTTVIVNNHMEYCDLLLEGNIQGFAFPMTLNDGETDIVVNSQEELEELIVACGDWGNPGSSNGDLILLLNGVLDIDSLGIEPCFTITFPLSVQEVDIDGTVIDNITVNSVDDIFDLIETTIIFNPYFIVYPVTITIIESEQVIVLENEIDLIFALSEYCQ